MKILVIAGSAIGAEAWVLSNTNPRPWSDYIIVHNADQLRGLRDPSGVFVGNWRERKDIFEILNMLLVNMTIPSKHKIIQDLLVQHIIEITK
jgi:hypothetical protein